MNLLNEIWKTYLDIAPFLFIGLTFAGFLHIFFKKNLIIKHLGSNNFTSVLKASILGVPLPLCSCGVVPTALYLRRQKASKGATLSFLISTPQTGIDSIIATYGLMGPIFAIFRPVAAFVTGIIGGVVTNLFTEKKKVVSNKIESSFECNLCEIKTSHKHKVWEKLRAGFKYAFSEFLDDIAWQLIVGIILAGIISYAIPDDYFADFGGNGLAGMLIMIAFGIPLYVCATASIPIAVSLIAKGISPGAAFIFLVVGPATNIATITLIGKVLGKKMIAIYLSVISIFAVLGGFALNYIFRFVSFQSGKMMHEHRSNNAILFGFMLLFSAALLISLYKKLKLMINDKKIGEENIMNENNKRFLVEGMTCNHCVSNVSSALKEIEGVEKVEISLANKQAILEGVVTDEEIIKAIDKAGYKAKRKT